MIICIFLLLEVANKIGEHVGDCKILLCVSPIGFGMEFDMQVLYYGCDFPHEKGAFCDKHIYDFYVVCCFTTPFLYETERGLKAGNPGDALVMPPGSVVYHGPISEEDCFYNDWMYVAGEDFGALLKEYPVPLGTAFPVGSTNFLKKCIHRIDDEIVLKQVGYEKIIAGCITEAIIEMHRFCLRQRSIETAASRMETVREHFLRHPEKQWTLEEMAMLSGYSVSRFSVLYVQEYGRSPKADLLEIRMELARQLLSYTELSVTEIAERCGFKSIYYFSKYFKRAVGAAPSEYSRGRGKTAAVTERAELA